MQIVTLTTDFGTSDFYIALLKGSLLSAQQDIHFADITHNVKNYNIVQAAYAVRHTFRAFPTGTIHLVSVHNFYIPEPRFLLIHYMGHYFVGPDNGVFSLIFEREKIDCFEIPLQQYDILCFRNAFVHAVNHIYSKMPVDAIGPRRTEITERFSLQAITAETMIRGTVIHIDHYENVVLNITRELWERYAYFRRFALFFKRHDPIIELSTTYADVEVGETLCLFNAADHLEIAINLGKAASMLSLEVDDTVQLEFY